MKILYCLCFLGVSISLHAKIIKVNNDLVQPFVFNKVPMAKVIEEVAEVMNETIVYDSVCLKHTDMVSLNIINPISKSEFKEYFVDLLGSEGLTYLEESFGGVVLNQRSISDFAVPVVENSDIPVTSKFVASVYQMSGPIAGRFSHNIRPNMSRMGRIINIKNANALVVFDKGSITKQLIQSAQEFDTKEIIEDHLNKLKEEASIESKKTKEEKRIAELEEKIKEMEREQNKSKESETTERGKK